MSGGREALGFDTLIHSCSSLSREFFQNRPKDSQGVKYIVNEALLGWMDYKLRRLRLQDIGTFGGIAKP